jgi:hypothetical protein
MDIQIWAIVTAMKPRYLKLTCELPGWVAVPIWISLKLELVTVNIKNASNNVVQLVLGEHLRLVLTLCD